MFRVRKKETNKQTAKANPFHQKDYTHTSVFICPSLSLANIYQAGSSIKVTSISGAGVFSPRKLDAAVLHVTMHSDYHEEEHVLRVTYL